MPDEAALLAARERLARRGIRHYTFVEDDIGDQATALATEPLGREGRRALRDYRLWKEVRYDPA